MPRNSIARVTYWLVCRDHKIKLIPFRGIGPTATRKLPRGCPTSLGKVVERGILTIDTSQHSSGDFSCQRKPFLSDSYGKMRSIFLLIWRAVWLGILTILVLFGTNTSLVAAHSNLEPNLKNCIKQPIVSGNLTLNLCTPRAHSESGDIVNILLILRSTGSASMQMNSITAGVFITDPNGKPVMRLQIFECFGGFGNCVLSAHTTRTISVPWNTSDTFTAATISGLYTVNISFSACPVSGPCLETVASQLKVTVALTDSDVNDNIGGVA